MATRFAGNGLSRTAMVYRIATMGLRVGERKVNIRIETR